MFRRPPDLDPIGDSLEAMFRRRLRRLPPEVADGQRLGPFQAVRRPLGDDPAAFGTRARAEVDHPIGAPDDRLVVLDDQHAVAQVAEPEQGRQQPVGVRGMEPGRRLVEQIRHSHQTRPDP